MRRPSLALLVLALAALAGPGCHRTTPPEQLSLILVTLDTTRADRLGAYGGHAVPTPNLDRIAREGAVFEEAVSQVPLTLPSHSSIMTGRYPATHGVRHNGIFRLRESEVTLAERLKAAGFETAAFVAAFVVNHGFGLEQGFDTYDDLPVDRASGDHWQVYTAQRTADEVNARVFQWLDAHRDVRRKFLWIHYYDPHHPYAAPEKPGRTLAGSGYDREISYVDACFGDLLQRLRQDGLLDRSLLVVASDHGESLGEHGEAQHGMFLYEPDVHVPLLMRAPGLVPAGARVKHPVELIDIAPTVLRMLKVPALDDAQGRSLVARLDGSDDGHAAVAHAETLMPRLEFGWAELRMQRDGRFKYIEAPRPELYDLAEDRAETRNLVTGDAANAARLAGALKQWTDATANDAAGDARQTLGEEDMARLRSLGYLAGGAVRADAPKTAAGAVLPDPKDRIGDARLLDEARELVQAGRFADGLAVIDRILAANPGNHDARRKRLMALIRMGRLADAEREAQDAVLIAQADAHASEALVEDALAGLASAYRLQNKNREAEDTYRKLLRMNPANDLATVDLARLLADTGRTPAAADTLNALLAREPQNGTVLSALFELQLASRDAAGALRTAEALARARRGQPKALLDAGRLLLREGKAEAALVCLEGVQQASEALSPELLGMIGMAQIESGRLDDAERSFRAIVALRPADPRPHLFLGNVALKRGNESAAREHFNDALGLDESFSAPLTSLGTWLLEQKRTGEAVKAFEDALRRNPQDARARAGLASARGAN